jgi:hypothetical protein
MKLSLVALVAVVAVVAGSCGAEGPALVVSLQVTEAHGVTMDTSNIQGFLLRVGEEQVPFSAQPQQQFELEFSSPPNGPTEVVLYGCEFDAACQAANATFVGCSTPDLQPRDKPQAVFVSLYPIPTADGAAPPGCDGLL